MNMLAGPLMQRFDTLLSEVLAWQQRAPGAQLQQHTLMWQCHVQVESMDAIIEEELVRDGESDNIQSIDVVAFNKL